LNILAIMEGNLDAKDYLLIELDGLERNIQRVTDGLKQEEIAWRPAFGANSIGLILFHVARSEDSFIQARLREAPEVWEKGKWYEVLSVSKDEAGAHYTAEQVNAFPVPKLEKLLAYTAAVRTATKEYVNTLTPTDFDRVVTMPHFGDMPVAVILALTVGHAAQHTGEISYLRGLQRGLDG
jgi:uncharacterized damage-inducible protein DinB